ncbi:sialin-like [Saccoglossus kowalevskii]|uniref:Sialin-like n=1 Tax=Saccoglossus kowalevskii TaxID=10224 RepID=A0ABM0GQC3_SACKO|nr:PREDICTED: sialin-like [Saccoglossus kowalevskii]
MYDKKADEKTALLGKRWNDDNDEDDYSEYKKVRCNFILARHVLALMFFVGFMNLYSVRNNLSVAIVAMVNTTGQPVQLYNESECYRPGEDDPTSAVDQSGDFFWDSYQQGILLGAYYYGYAIAQVFGAWMEKRIGGRIVMACSMGLASIVTLLTPPAAYLGFWVIFLCRFLIGLFHAVVYPTHHGMWGKWAPPLERSKLLSFDTSGTTIGTVAINSLAGVLSAAYGWPSVFYLSGGLCLIWSVCWFLIIHDTPSKHPRITKREKDYIINSIGPSAVDMDTRIPWKAIFTSIPVWGLVIGHTFSNWGLYTLMTGLPSFNSQVLAFDLSANGVISALPYAGSWVFTVVGAYIADELRSRKIMTTKAVRRLFTVFGMYFPAFFLVSNSYVGCNRAMAVSFLVLANSFASVSYPGFKVNHVEIAPRFAGVLYGITNTAATIPGFVAPYVNGIILQNRGTTADSWLIIFLIAAGFYFVGGTVVLATIKTEEQEWAKPRKYGDRVRVELDSSSEDSS